MTILNGLLVLLATVPVPRDLPLPLPLGNLDLQVILVALFLLHILFVNLMIGGVLFSTFFEILGLGWSRYDRLGQKIAATVTVNKSLAVVLGVGPLLAISLLYTIQFYAANALTGHVWIMIVPVVTVAFLLSYWYKYSWPSWTGPRKSQHIALGVITALVYLGIPFIFLANINLMLFPESWSDVAGYFSSLSIGNVFPRYFHFLTASVALTSLFLAGYFGRAKAQPEQISPEFSRGGLRRLFVTIAFYMTLLQLVFGPLLYATLPKQGLSWSLFWVILAGVTFAVLTLLVMYRLMRSPREELGRGYTAVWALLTLVVIFMATGRHLYREGSLAEHRALVDERTARFDGLERGAKMRLAAGLALGDARSAGPTGKSAFNNCASCHSLNNDKAAPPITEIQQLYGDKVEKVVAWAKDPAVKRKQYAPMPSFAHLEEQTLELAAEYMLELGKEQEEQN